MCAHVVYVATNPLSGPHVQSQVLPYLARLPEHRFTLLTHEEGTEAPADARLPRNVDWRPLRRRGPPVGTALSVVEGVRAVRAIARRDPIAIAHARSYVAAEIAMRAARGLRTPWLFDMRGFYLDERIDGGLLRAGSLAERVLRREERRLVREADHVVVLTRAAKALVERGRFGETGAPIDVIPCGTDLGTFTPPPERPPGPPTLVYSGTLGPFYLEREMAAFAGSLRSYVPDLRVLVASRQSTDSFRALLAGAGLPPDAIATTRLAPADVPRALQRCHAGLVFVRPSLAKTAASPIKVSEFLATGLPVAVSAGCGDIAGWVDREGVGVTVDPRDEASLRDGAERLAGLLDDPSTPSRCRKFAEAEFSVEEGARTYARVYARLLAR